MAVAKEQIRQIISENNSNSVADIYTLLKESFKDILQELILDHIKIQQIFLSQVKLWKKPRFLVVTSFSGNRQPSIQGKKSPSPIGSTTPLCISGR